MIRTSARLHKYFAVLVLIYGQLCILFGIFAYYDGVQSNNERERDTLILFFVHLGFHFVLFVVLEIFYRLWRNKSGPLTTKEVTKTLTTEEYEKLVHNGGKFCILDDFILDTKRFASRHPGGQFLIDSTVGRDVSKYFYGGYKMENNKHNMDGPYRHSMSARKIVQGLIVARLNNPAPKALAKIVERT